MGAYGDAEAFVVGGTPRLCVVPCFAGFVAPTLARAACQYCRRPRPWVSPRRALEQEGGDLFSPHERFRNVVELLGVWGQGTANGRVLRACLRPHVGSVLRLLSSAVHQATAAALLPELLPLLHLAEADQARLTAQYSVDKGPIANVSGKGEGGDDEGVRDSAVKQVRLVSVFGGGGGGGGM